MKLPPSLSPLQYPGLRADIRICDSKARRLMNNFRIYVSFAYGKQLLDEVGIVCLRGKKARTVVSSTFVFAVLNVGM